MTTTSPLAAEQLGQTVRNVCLHMLLWGQMAYLASAHEELHASRAIREDRHCHRHLLLPVILAKDVSS